VRRASFPFYACMRRALSLAQCVCAEQRVLAKKIAGDDENPARHKKRAPRGVFTDGVPNWLEVISEKCEMMNLI
jgi:hypothetical protein